MNHPLYKHRCTNIIKVESIDPSMKGVTMFDTPHECCTKLVNEQNKKGLETIDIGDCIIQEADDCIGYNKVHNDCLVGRRWHPSKSQRETWYSMLNFFVCVKKLKNAPSFFAKLNFFW